MSVVRNFRPLKLPPRWTPPPGTTPEPAKFLDIVMLVAVLISAVIIGSIAYDSGLLRELARQEDQLRGLKERAGTLQQGVYEARVTHHQNELEAATPHILTEYLDAQLIGSHANVSWSYSGHDDGKHVGYEVQLFRLGAPDKNCDPKGNDFFSCESELTVKQFIASDVQGHASRIPPIFDKKLTSGRYAWRVAAVPIGSAVSESESPSVDAQNRLSAWSAFATFTLYQSQLDRILATHHVRVGTNLEQSTPFSRRDPNGNIVGFDVALISTIVERCLGAGSDGLFFDQERCSQYLDNARAQSSVSPQLSQSQNCDSISQTLCVTLVPVHKWKDWQSALKRKEIDLFVGGVTRAVARERGGIVFTNGYLPYSTKLYTRAADAPKPPDFSHWLTKDRIIGVIQASTNETLLAELQTYLKKHNATQARYLKEYSFPSFPALESAMDSGEIDGVLIDSTFVNEPDWVPLDGINKEVWANYLTKYIGGEGGEEIAIAVGTDNVRSAVANPHIPGPLYNALQLALSDNSVIRQQYIPFLCREYWSDSGNDFRCPQASGRHR